MPSASPRYQGDYNHACMCQYRPSSGTLWHTYEDLANKSPNEYTWNSGELMRLAYKILIDKRFTEFTELAL